MPDEVINLIIKLIFAGLSLLLTYYIVPAIKNSRNSKLVRSCVRAADKLARSGQLPKAQKLDYVLDVLRSCGVKITAEVEATIEAEVTELDIALAEVVAAAAESETE